MRHHNPDVIFFTETKIAADQVQAILNRLGFYLLFQCPPMGKKGGLVLTWRPGVEIEPIFSNKKRISGMVYSDPPSSPWMISCIYGPSIIAQKEDFWALLDSHAASFKGPWLLLGDFHAITGQDEKMGGRPYASSSSGGFYPFFTRNGLVDLGFSGNPFTWSNKRSGLANVRERLDRGVANVDWTLIFPNASVFHVPATTSDHNPILICTNGGPYTLPKPFRFEAFWIREKTSAHIVAEAWNTPVVGSPAFKLCQKVKAVKQALRIWNKHHFGIIQDNIRQILHSIDEVQQLPATLENRTYEDNLHEALQEQLRREEVLWKQKSREEWLTSKDLNTRYFHLSTVIRRRQNAIN